LPSGFAGERQDGAMANAPHNHDEQESRRILGRIEAGYSKRKLDAVLKETVEFYRVLFEGAKLDVAWGVVCSLTARITRLRAMTIRSPGRDRDGPAQMQFIVDGDKAFQAAQAHIGIASSIARQLLE